MRNRTMPAAIHAILLSLVFLAAALPASGVDRIKATLTLTNLPVTGDTIDVNGDSRYWTNQTTSSAIATNTTIAASATNLWDQIIANPYSGPLIYNWLTATQLTLIGQPGLAMEVTETGNWLDVAYATQVVTTAKGVRVPLSAEPTASERTNTASLLVTGIQDYATNAWATDAVALSNYVNLGTGWQLLNGKDISNAVLSGTISNATLIGGNVYRVTNGWFWKPLINSPYTTNLTNYGQGIHSPGSGTLSERFGLASVASGAFSLAAGYAATVGGAYGVSLGSGSIASIYGIALGTSAESGNHVITIGTGSTGSGTNTIIIGNNSHTGDGTNTIVIGHNITETSANRFVAGNSAQTVVIAGLLSAAAQTNSTFKGTNVWDGDLSLTKSTISSIADGHNTITPGDVVYVYLDGSPTAAWQLGGIQGGRNGKYHIIENGTGYGVTVVNNSGTEPGATNRIYTQDAANLAISGRGVMAVHYNSSISRWVVDYPPSSTTNDLELFTNVVSGILLDYGSAGELFYFYGSSNATGINVEASTTNWAYASVSTNTAVTNTISATTNGQYLAAYASDKSFLALASGLGVVDVWLWKGAAGAVAVRPEIYIYNTVSDLEEYEFTPAPAYQSLGTAPAKFSFAVPITDYNSTTNFRVIVKLKAEVTSGAPDIYIATEGNYTAHTSFPVPLASYVVKAGDTMTGALTNNTGFWGDGLGLTNVSNPTLATLWLRAASQAIDGTPAILTNWDDTITLNAGSSTTLGSITNTLAGWYQFTWNVSFIEDTGVGVTVLLYTNGVSTTVGSQGGYLADYGFHIGGSWAQYLPANCRSDLRVSGSGGTTMGTSYADFTVTKIQ